MKSSSNKVPENQSVQPFFSLISEEIFLSLATIPVLMGVVGTKALMEMMAEIGQASEEIFRGDRLPVLNFPKSHSAKNGE